MTRHLHGECRHTALGSDAGSTQQLLINLATTCPSCIVSVYVRGAVSAATCVHFNICRVQCCRRRILSIATMLSSAAIVYRSQTSARIHQQAPAQAIHQRPCSRASSQHCCEPRKVDVRAIDPNDSLRETHIDELGVSVTDDMGDLLAVRTALLWYTHCPHLRRNCHTKCPKQITLSYKTAIANYSHRNTLSETCRARRCYPQTCLLLCGAIKSVTSFLKLLLTLAESLMLAFKMVWRN